jgi:predicted nuclease of predicted toxin-antitoxin system
MRLLLDEMMDQRLRSHFTMGGHQSATVEEAGFKGLVNGALLAAADVQGFDVLITTDKNIEYQNNLTGKRISLLIIRVFRNKLSFVLPHLPEALRALQSLAPGEVRHVGEPSLVAKGKS